ncbi:hypothetical protein O9929_02000 [Vibrio lentus]|nr:hypothetical protein [Vibrio lentus]
MATACLDLRGSSRNTVIDDLLMYGKDIGDLADPISLVFSNNPNIKPGGRAVSRSAKHDDLAALKSF